MRLNLPSLLLRNSVFAHQTVRISAINYSISATTREQYQLWHQPEKPLKLLRNIFYNQKNKNLYKPILSQVRLFQTGGSGSDDREGGQEENRLKRLPSLTQFPSLIWPKFTNTIRNWFLVYFVIKPYFDKDFSMHDFMKGAHQAVALISTKLSAGELDDLEGLVEPVTLKELRETISSFSVSQQDLLRVAAEDIFFSFPYQVGIIIPDQPDPTKYIESGMKPPPQTRHVEITVVLHVLRGMAETQKKNENSTFSVVDFTKDEENRFKVMVCNYRFFRDFTEGCKDPSWIINMVNHFLPAESKEMGMR